EEEIADRDYRDMHRENSPLMQAEDAVLIDSTELTIEQVADEILKLCN
ncbi:MAG: (d)CMP kinase, partial [Lachnospiraceae bacterium]|nr:(d)CMP kinase [Lachnospiraceae bacterium]